MRKIVVAIITLSLIFTMMPGKDIKASDTNDVTLVKKCIEAYFDSCYHGLIDGKETDNSKYFVDNINAKISQKMVNTKIEIAKMANELIDWYKLDYIYNDINKESVDKATVKVELESQFHYSDAPENLDSGYNEKYTIELRNIGEWKIYSIQSDTDLGYLDLYEKFGKENIKSQKITEEQLDTFFEGKQRTVENFLDLTTENVEKKMKGKNTVDIKVSDEMENNKLQRSAVTARTATTYSYSSYKGVEYAMKYASNLDASQLIFAEAGLDCTNFVSQCVWAAYGGWDSDATVAQNRKRVKDKKRMTGSWYGAQYGYGDIADNWCGVTYFYNYVTNTSKTYGPKGTGYGTASTSKFDLSNVKTGDVVQFYNSNYGNWRHSVYVVSATRIGESSYKVFVCAHSNNARNVSITNYLQNASFTKARGIHFKAANFSS